ncbi:MAG TPA: hypothetical protein VFC99_01200, partial [Acidimicrobiia bacterium]|nr:hypothetical protein [Acidimicrobiia bacterium]
FVVWGAIHGGFLAVEHWRRTRRAELGLADPPDTFWRRWGARLVTFHVVCLAWIFFRAESFTNAGDILARLFDPAHWSDASPLVKVSVLLAIAAGICEQFVSRGALARLMAAFSRLSPVAQGVTLGFALMLINTMGPRGVAPFIYFRF